MGEKFNMFRIDLEHFSSVLGSGNLGVFEKAVTYVENRYLPYIAPNEFDLVKNAYNENLKRMLFEGSVKIEFVSTEKLITIPETLITRLEMLDRTLSHSIVALFSTSRNFYEYGGLTYWRYIELYNMLEAKANLTQYFQQIWKYIVHGRGLANDESKGLYHYAFLNTIEIVEVLKSLEYFYKDAGSIFLEQGNENLSSDEVKSTLNNLEKVFQDIISHQGDFFFYIA